MRANACLVNRGERSCTFVAKLSSCGRKRSSLLTSSAFHAKPDSLSHFVCVSLTTWSSSNFMSRRSWPHVKIYLESPQSLLSANENSTILWQLVKKLLTIWSDVSTFPELNFRLSWKLQGGQRSLKTFVDRFG